MLLTKVELDRGSCSTPGCTEDHGEVWLHPKCHPKKGTRIRYRRGSGVLEVTCRGCQAPVVEIAVAAGLVQ